MHKQKVLTKMFRPSKKYPSRDTVPLRVKWYSMYANTAFHLVRKMYQIEYVDVDLNLYFHVSKICLYVNQRHQSPVAKPLMRSFMASLMPTYSLN